MYEKNAVMTDLESAREYMEALFEQMRDKGVGLYVDRSEERRVGKEC